MTVLDEALALAALEIPVFPLRVTDKRPVVEGGFKSASTDPDTVARMFADPAAGLIGVPTGPPSGIDVLYIDPGKGGLEWLHANEGTQFLLTRRHHTRSAGFYFLFTHAAGLRNSASKIAPAVHIRADGGYIVWWPAAGLHVEGATVAYSRDQVATWPDWLLVEGMRRQHREGTAPPAAELAPPSATALLAVLAGDLDNPAAVTRDEYTALTWPFKVACERWTRSASWTRTTPRTYATPRQNGPPNGKANTVDVEFELAKSDPIGRCGRTTLAAGAMSSRLPTAAAWTRSRGAPRPRPPSWRAARRT